MVVLHEDEQIDRMDIFTLVLFCFVSFPLARFLRSYLSISCFSPSRTAAIYASENEQEQR